MEINNEDKNIDPKSTNSIDKFLILGLVVFATFMLFFNFTPNSKEEFLLEPLEIETSKNNLVKLNVGVADTEKEQKKGLTFRDSMPLNEGVLYVFGAGKALNMNTKNNRFSTDLLFIDEKGIVKKIIKNTKPDSAEIMSPDSDIAAVLEVNGSTADKNDIQINDVVLHSFFKNVKNSNEEKMQK